MQTRHGNPDISPAAIWCLSARRRAWRLCLACGRHSGVSSRAADWPRLQRGPWRVARLISWRSRNGFSHETTSRRRALIGAPAEYPLGLDAAEKGARKGMWI